MTPCIRVLDPHVVNHIAAGEVIERPAAVVKELVENALDAQATEIHVIVEDGGRSFISVTDNGRGMEKEDLELCIERHATSKLRCPQDLGNIITLGFRGEALPSIGAVSRLTITSRALQADQGWALTLDTGIKEGVRPVSWPQGGTRVVVENVFKNFPVRLKFLRSPATETAYIQDMMMRVALAHPQVAFFLSHGQRSLLAYPKVQEQNMTGFLQRVTQVLGGEFTNHAVPVEIIAHEWHLRGLLGMPALSLKRSSEIYLSLNQRSIKDRLLGKFLRQAYSDVTPEGKMSPVVLELMVPAQEIDVNVHPTKAEVRFVKPERVKRLIDQAFQNLAPVAVQVNDLWSPDLASCVQTVTSLQENNTEQPEVRPIPSWGGPLILQESPWQRPVRESGKLYSTFQEKPLPVYGKAEETFSSAHAVQETYLPTPPLGWALAHLHKTYILSQTSDGLMIVDHHAAHERITYELMKKTMHDAQGLSCALLLAPEVLTVAPQELDILIKGKEFLERVGWQIDSFNEEHLLVKGVPSMLTWEEASVLLIKIAENWSAEMSPSVEGIWSLMDRAWANIACRASLKAGRSLQLTEMNALLRQLENVPNGSCCNHGRPTMMQINLKDLHRMFGRMGMSKDVAFMP